MAAFRGRGGCTGPSFRDNSPSLHLPDLVRLCMRYSICGGAGFGVLLRSVSCFSFGFLDPLDTLRGPLGA